jgi:hypothetical protein
MSTSTVSVCINGLIQSSNPNIVTDHLTHRNKFLELQAPVLFPFQVNPHPRMRSKEDDLTLM